MLWLHSMCSYHHLLTTKTVHNLCKKLLIVAGLYALMEWKGWQRWAFPLVVVGMNSIAIYVMSWTMSDFFGNALTRHFGHAIALLAGPTFQPVLHGLLIMLIFWWILFWMYRRKLFLKI